MRKVAILLFNEVEEMDFAGPLEVFGAANEVNGAPLFDVFFVAESKSPIKCVNGLQVMANYDFASSPLPDIMVVPGGSGTKKEVDNKLLMQWVNDTHSWVEITMSVCSGARLLGALGLLDNLPYTTHYQVFDDVEKLAPKGLPKPGERYIDTGKTMTSAGISAGMDLALHIVNKLHGLELKEQVAAYMEYAPPENI